MMPRLLAALDFRSNNGTHRPLLNALEAIRHAEGEGRQYFRVEEIAVDGVVRPKCRDVVIEDAPGGGHRVNRINYEICVLQTLGERLRCKEVWVAGADRFHNPDEDLPTDFAARRAACYERLGLPVQARTLTEALRAEMAAALSQLDRGMPRNPGVRLVPRRRHPIVVRPLEPQTEPSGLGALKVELGRRWPMTGLLDLSIPELLLRGLPIVPAALGIRQQPQEGPRPLLGEAGDDEAPVGREDVAHWGFASALMRRRRRFASAATKWYAESLTSGSGASLR
jgi:hypothetical protein